MKCLTLRIMPLALFGVGVACSGVSPNSSGLDPWGDDGGDSASSGKGSGSANGSGGAASCGSCSSDGECQRGCGSPAANTVWCCSSSVGCYAFSSTSCPMSTASATGGNGTSGAAPSGTACMGASTCGGGMKCCVGGGGGQGGTCQASCSSGVEACQQNSDCSSGICLVAVCLPTFGGGGGRPRDAGAGG